MPLHTGKDASDTEYLQRLYDEYCKIALSQLLRDCSSSMPKIMMDGKLEVVTAGVSQAAHAFATAMLNERKK